MANRWPGTVHVAVAWPLLQRGIVEGVRNRAEQLLALHAVDPSQRVPPAATDEDDGVDRLALSVARRQQRQVHLVAFEIAARTAELMRRARSARPLLRLDPTDTKPADVGQLALSHDDEPWLDSPPPRTLRLV